MKTILACGSREWRDRGAICLVLMCEPQAQGWGDEPIRVIHGACRGADLIAAKEAKDLGYTVKPFPAHWEVTEDTPPHRIKRHPDGRQYDIGAGRERNLRMLDDEPDLVIAFGVGNGTSHTVTEAHKRGIPVRRF